MQAAVQQLPAPSLRSPGGTGCQILCLWLHWQMASTPGEVLALFSRATRRTSSPFWLVSFHRLSAEGCMSCEQSYHLHRD